MSNHQKTYMAHSAANGYSEPVIEHLNHTAYLAERNAEFAPFEGKLAGMFHDLPKYGDLFAQRLLGKVSKIDHWSLGSWILLQRYKEMGFAAAMAVQGHHIGLQRGRETESLNPAKLITSHPLKLRLSENDSKVLEERFLADGGSFPTVPPGTESQFIRNAKANHHVAAMLDVRMLYSALVDADYLATEAHFGRLEDGTYNFRKCGRTLDPKSAISQVGAFLDSIHQNSKADPVVCKMREDLQQACINAAQNPPGIYTLTAPTGSGKTIAMLQFALHHALKNNLRRIILVLPFLSLIEQTAQIYRDIFGDAGDVPFVLEDHSMTEPEDDTEDPNNTHRLLAENWDAPIIVTTSVRFCESLFANRPSACRKLHNISRSVVLFDEVQTLPAQLAIPTLAAFSHLYKEYNCSFVLSTATQPAFNALSDSVRKYAPGGWEAQEIVPPELGLFSRVKRVSAIWPAKLQPTSFEDIAEQMLVYPQVLTIVNLKRHSRRLFEIIESRNGDQGLFHISTDMCPAHRTDVLKDIKNQLKSGRLCRVISTQCVEAGVDLDFPVVFRSWGPLEALAQAAGRCNREGRLSEGIFNIFLPPLEDEQYPGLEYKTAASEVKKLYLESDGMLDLQDPLLFQRYYREYYNLEGLEKEKDELFALLRIYDFVGVAKQYRLIKNDTINVLVPYNERIEQYYELRKLALQQGISRNWLRQARPLSISLYKGALKKGLGDWLEPIKSRDSDTGWYIYLNEKHYSSKLGLVEPEVQDFLFVEDEK